MFIEAGLITGYLIAWAVGKAKLVAGRLDTELDSVLNAGMDQLHQVVASRLGLDPALVELSKEAQTTGVVSSLTRQRVELSLEAAAAKDASFAEAVTALLDQLQAATHAGLALASGPGSTAIAGNVDIRAETGSAAALHMRDVQLGVTPRPDPHQPDR